MKSHASWSIHLDAEDISELVRKYPTNTDRLTEELLSVAAESEELGDLLRFVWRENTLRELCAKDLEWSSLYVWVEEAADSYFDVRPEDVRLMLELRWNFNLTFD